MKKFAIALVEPPFGAKELFADFAVVVVHRQMITQILDDAEIDAIAFFGTEALNAVMPRHGFTVEKTFNYRVFPFNYHKNKKLVICLPDVLPSKFSKGEKIAELPLLKNALHDLKEALKDFSYLQIPDYSESDAIDVLMNEDAAIEWVAHCTGKICALDYETTGLNPYREGHRIASASIAVKENTRWMSKGFNFYDGEKFVSAFKNFLRKSKIICHNIAFEADWSYCCVGEELENFHHDTMIAQHCIDNNAFVGLKLWVYLYFGIVYEVPFEIFLNGDSEFNQMKNFPVGSVPSKILWYNALDSLYTGWLFDKQVDFFKKNRKLQDGFFLFMDAAKELWHAHKIGIRVDDTEMKKAFDFSHKQRDMILQKVYAHDWVKKWKRGMWDITKVQHLKDIIKINAGIEMEKLEEHDLQKVPGDFTKLVIEYRKNEKLHGTYLEQFVRENCNGVIHPQYHLHKVVTFRTSSSNPNFQNIPKRDKEMNKIIRGLLFPTKGNQLMEWDYKGVEVAISACYNKDPELLRYLREPGTDMHRDTAAILFKIKPEEVSKEQRQLAKNKFVFPIFYGATFASMAQNLWESMKPEWKKSLGIARFEQFEAHVKKVEDDWWRRRFPVYGKWRQGAYSKFIEDGSIDYYTGFRAYAPAGFTELVNRPIQGSACHCLLRTLTRAGKRIRGLSGRSAIIGQIHDSIIGDIHPDEESACNEIIREEGIINLRNDWKWIIAPLEIEVAKAPVDGAWSLLEEYLKLEE